MLGRVAGSGTDSDRISENSEEEGVGEGRAVKRYTEKDMDGAFVIGLSLGLGAVITFGLGTFLGFLIGRL